MTNKNNDPLTAPCIKWGFVQSLNIEIINYLCSWLDEKEGIKTPPDSKLRALALIMMEITILIIGCILLVFVALIIFGRIQVVKEKREFRKVLKTHKQLGFPNLEKKTQFSIIETGNLLPILNLTPEINFRFNALKLLQFYITVTKEEFIEHLINSGYIEKHTIIDEPDTWLQDGIWLKDYGEKKIIIEQGRGHVFNTWTINTTREAAKIYCEILWKKINY
jgi:hypothetical protein